MFIADDETELIFTIHSTTVHYSIINLSFAAITYGDILTVQPFSNSVDSLDLTGQNLFDVFEFHAQRAFRQNVARNLLHVSGLKVTYNRTNPIGHRVVSLETHCRACESNSQQTYKPIDRMQIYRVIAFNYLINGGDGFAIITRNKRNHM